MSIRRVAYEALFDIAENGAYANLRMKQALAGLEEREKKWVSAAVYTTLDHLGKIDYIIGYFTKGKKLHTQIRNVLRLGVCQILYMDVPDAAACNESVKLTKEIGKGALSGFINGVLRSVSREKEVPLPEEPVQRLSVEYSWPLWLIRYWLESYPVEFVEKMLAAPAQTGMTLRAQPPFLPQLFEKELDLRNIAFTRGKYDSNAFYIKKSLDISRDPLFLKGSISVQSESAMLVCRAAGIAPGVKVLDCCAAPGGKASYLYALCRDCEITAWDIHPHRVELMKNTFDRLHVTAKAQVWDAGINRPELNDSFDMVIIDAPCSGLGTVGTKPDIKYSKSSEMINSLVLLQRRILSACAPYVKSGGSLLYATCTVSKRENEENMDWFVKTYCEFVPDDLSKYLNGFDNKRFAGGMLQLFPHLDGLEGFFIARYLKH